MKKTLIWGIVFLAGWWFTPKSLWLVQILFLVLTLNCFVTALVEICRRNFGTLRPEQAFDLVNDVLQPSPEHPVDQFGPSWCEVIQVYADTTPKPAEELTEKQQQLKAERLSGLHEEYAQAKQYGLIVEDEYDCWGGHVLTELGLKYGKRGPIGGYEFYLNSFKTYKIENVRATRNTASATFVLEFERTELALLLKQQPVLRRTFDIKAERTNTGDWFLTELIETGLLDGPKPFPLAEFRNWQAYLDADRKKQEERDKWHDEPDVKAALARYNAETDPEKKKILSEEWRMAGEAARERLGY